MLYLPSRQIINPVGSMFDVSSNTIFLNLPLVKRWMWCYLGEGAEQFPEVTVSSCLSILRSVSLPACSRWESWLSSAEWAWQLIQMMFNKICAQFSGFVETGQRLRSICRRKCVCLWLFNNINAATLVISITNVKFAEVILVTVVASELSIDNITIYNACTYIHMIVT